MNGFLLKLLSSPDLNISLSNRSNRLEEYIKRKVLVFKGKKKYQIKLSTKSSLFFLINEIEESTDIKFGTNIKDVLEIPRRVESIIKETLDSNIIGRYDFVIKIVVMKYLVYKYNSKELDIFQEIVDIIEGKDENYNPNRYLSPLLKVIIEAKATASEIVILINKLLLNEDKQSVVYEFVKNLCNTKLKIAIEVKDEYDNSLKGDKTIVSFYFLSFLYNQTRSIKYLDEAFRHYENNRNEYFVFLININYSKKVVINEIIQQLNSIKVDGEILIINYTIAVTRMFSYKKLSNDNIDFLFDKLRNFIKSKNEKIAYRVLNECMRSINDYEEKRFELLMSFLKEGNTKMFEWQFLLDNFKEPIYFFKLYNFILKNIGIKAKLNFIHNDFDAMFRINEEACLKLSVEMFNNENMHVRFGAIRLISNSNHNIDADLFFSNAHERLQLRAIEAFRLYPLGIEEFFKFLIALRNSKYKSVQQFLLETLIYLSIEAYGDSVSVLVDDLIPKNERRKAFYKKYLKSKLELADYFKSKLAINELNPFVNETGLMNNYYELEREQDARLMDEAQKKSIFGIIGSDKPYIVVKGNSWRIEGRKVTPLSRSGISRMLDFRMYKYPERTERVISSVNSKI